MVVALHVIKEANVILGGGLRTTHYLLPLNVYPPDVCQETVRKQKENPKSAT